MTDTSNLSRARFLGVALYLPFLLFLSIPLNIYLGNMADVPYSLPKVAAVWLQAFVPCAIILLALTFLPLPRLREAYFRVAVALSISAWIVSSFLYGDYGMFNGEALDIDTGSAKALLELFGCAALLALSLWKKSIARLFSDLVLGIFALTLVINAYQIYTSYESNSWSDMMTDLSLEVLEESGFDRMGEFSRERNLVHIVLDELQSDVFERALARDKSIADVLEGFTVFPDTAGVFPYTEMSLPAMLSGATYDNSYNKYEYLDKQVRNSPFLAAIRDAGYETDLHLHPAYCSDNYLTDCTGVPGRSLRPAALNLLDLALFRAAPDTLKPAVHNNGMGQIQRAFSDIDYLSSESGIGYVLLERFVADFEVVEGPPRYKFFQSLVTHAPLVLNTDCSLSAQHNPQRMPFMVAQARCAFSQLGVLFDRMRSAGVYDNTMIVISSDHGGNYIDPSLSDALKSRDIKPKHFARAKATLLVKPFGANGPLQRSDVSAQLADIPRTLLSGAGISEDLPGVDIFSGEDVGERVRYFAFIEWNFGTAVSERLQGYTPYRIVGDVRDPASWEKVDAP